MPRSNTRHLAETLVSLARQLLCMPSRGDTVVTATLGNTDAIDHLSFVEDGVDGVDLLGDGSSVDLDFDQVGLLLAEGETFHLSVANGPNGLGVLFEHVQVTLDRFLAIFRLPSLVGLGESLLLGGEPVTVESTADLIGKMRGPDGLD